jgi:hypothetical protein
MEHRLPSDPSTEEEDIMHDLLTLLIFGIGVIIVAVCLFILASPTLITW